MELVADPAEAEEGKSVWVTTLPNGDRMQYKDNTAEELKPIMICLASDPETNQVSDSASYEVTLAPIVVGEEEYFLYINKLNHLLALMVLRRVQEDSTKLLIKNTSKWNYGENLILEWSLNNSEFKYGKIVLK